MASDSLIAISAVGDAAAILVLAYAAYWAFQIRRALFVGIYRSQAFWIGFFSLYLIPYVVGIDAGANGSNLGYALFVVSYYVVVAFLLFRLIDVDVGVARRSDPRLREVLNWSRLRKVVWAIMLVGATGVIAVTLLSNSGYYISNQIMALTQASVFLPFLLSGVPALFVGARRSGDMTFRRYLKWLALFFVLLLATSLAYFIETAGASPISIDVFNAIGGLSTIPGAYCLYRSAKSLAPLGHMTE